MAAAPTSSFNEGAQKSELNQYWYSDATIQAFVEEIIESCPENGKVAFLSSPSVYFAFPPEVRQKRGFKLFEFDKKWEKDPGFVFYDFNAPTDKLPLSLWATFDYIVVDPPFITREVWAKYIDTVTTIGVPAKPPAPGVAPQPAYKVLLTTVIENHAVLENLLDQPLFIPAFRPTVCHLTYQYNCFINYPHLSGPTGVTKTNAEIPPEDDEQCRARMMANDMRESEVEFLAQMRTRKRDGERQLPAPREGVEAALKADRFDSCPASKAIAAAAAAAKPVAHEGPDGQMRFAGLPAGVSEYKDGAEQPPEEGPQIPDEAFGPAYMTAMQRRSALDAFKKAVDVAFKKLDVISIARESAAAKKIENGGEKEVAELMEHADETSKIAAAYVALCRASSGSDDLAASKKDVALVNTMNSFVQRLKSDTGLYDKDAAKEYAIDATRNFKSPAFNRQKELLQVMKNEKKKYAATAGGAAAAASA